MLHPDAPRHLAKGGTLMNFLQKGYVRNSAEPQAIKI